MVFDDDKIYQKGEYYYEGENYYSLSGKKLNKKCNQLNLFNGDYISLFIPSTRSSNVYFEIMVHHQTNMHKTFKLVFEYK